MDAPDIAGHVPRIARVTHVRAMVMAVLVTTLVVLCGSARFSSNASAVARSSTSIAELRRSEAVLQYQLADVQRRQAYARDRLDLTSSIRDDALQRLTARIVDRYKRNDQDSLVAILVAGRNVGEMVARIRAQHDVSTYEMRLVDELDQASDAALADSQDSERLDAELVRISARLNTVRSEIDLQVAAQHIRAKQRRARAAADRARSRVAAGTLVANRGVPNSVVPGAGTTSGPLVPASAISAASLDAYLFSKSSPMAGNGAFVVLSAQRWGIDPRLIIAIAGAESNFGAVTCADFNAWGWSCPNSPVQFTSWGDGIETIASGLRRYYIDEGRTTVAMIQQKWAPSGAANDPTGLNNNWVANVTRFMGELGGSPDSLVVGFATPGAGSMLVRGPLG